VERLDRRIQRVGQAELIAQPVMQPGRHAVVERAHQRHGRHVVRVDLGHAAPQHLDRRLRAAVGHVEEARAALLGPGRLGHRRRARRQAGHVAGGGAQHRLVLDRAGRDQDRVGRVVVAREVPAHVRVGEALHVLGRPDDPLGQRVALEQDPARDVSAVDLGAALVEVLGQLLEDELALELEVGEQRPPEQLAEQLHADLDQAGHQRHLEQRVVAPGLGVERPAQRLDGEVDVVRGGVPLGAAEQHVLDEVAEPVVLGALQPRPHLHVQDETGSVEVRQLDGDDAQLARGHGGARLDVGQHGWRRSTRGPSSCQRARPFGRLCRRAR
jgi:hypothetical protein